MEESKREQSTFGATEKDILAILGSFQQEFEKTEREDKRKITRVEYYESIKMEKCEIDGVFITVEQSSDGNISYHLCYQSSQNEICTMDAEGNIKINANWEESIRETDLRKYLNKDNEMTSKNKDNFDKISDSKNKKEIHEKNIDPQVKQLLNSVSIPIETKEIKKSSEKYLEEVSRKLSEAEIPDEIERTDYELEQEENAIISYKELMEKKDSIQTIDEEEAIISIEELMNRNNSKEEKITKENYQDKTDYKDDKLYNLTEDEENDDFLRELKQFRNDL